MSNREIKLTFEILSVAQVCFPADKVVPVLKPQEGESTAVTFKTTLSSHCFTINDEIWRVGKKILGHLYCNTRAHKMKNGTERKHLHCANIFHGTKKRKKTSCINNNTVLLCCAVCILMATNSTIISVWRRMQAGVGGGGGIVCEFLVCHFCDSLCSGGSHADLD